MKNFFDFLKKTWLLFLLLFVAPIVVVVVFVIKEYVFHSINLSAGEWANLMGCVFSYWGTILLGTIAFWQNDRVMRLEERNAEIQETELKLKSKPDFNVDTVSLYFKGFDGENIEFETIHKSGYRKTYQSSVKIDKDISCLTLYIELKNFTDALACNVEAYESIIDKEYRKNIFVMGSYVHKTIKENESVFLSYHVNFNDIKPLNGIRYVTYNFNLNYENIYHHSFYNNMNVFVGIVEKEEVTIQIGIGNQYEGRKDLEPKEIISDKKTK